MATYPTPDYTMASGIDSKHGIEIPMAFAETMIEEFWPETVFSEISNHNFEKRFQQGGIDVLRVRTLPTPIVREQSKHEALIYDRPKGSYVDVPVDRGFYWSFQTDEVETKQIDLDYVTAWIQEYGRALADEVDQKLLSIVYVNVHSSNAGSSAGAISGNIDLGVTGTPRQVTANNVMQVIAQCAQVMGEQNVPKDNTWWMVIPEWMKTLLLQSNLSNASITGDSKSPLRNGDIGINVGGFKIMVSNNLTTASDGGNTAFHAMFGSPRGLTFAAQLDKSEMMNNPWQFGQLVRALFVYGFKETKPEALGDLYVYE